MKRISIALLCLFAPLLANAATDATLLNLKMTNTTIGFVSLAIFVISYMLVMSEEFLHLRKSKPVVLSAGLIWLMIGAVSQDNGISEKVYAALNHNILEFAHLFLFLLVAMTYVNAMEERNVFEALRSYLVRRGFTYRQLFWVTGILSFFISPIADNLTTALLMCAVIMALGAGNARFIAIACINVVVSANAGGAFSPFGDITTLMVWQKGIVNFFTFFHIFIPSLVCYIIPAAIMHFAVPDMKPESSSEVVRMKVGAKRIMSLFIMTIITAVSFHNFLHLPPMLGMMTGLSYLNFFAFYLKKYEERLLGASRIDEALQPFDIFNKIKRAEWDTLFFFYGIILSVGGLATLGYLELASHVMYTQWGSNLPAIHSATPANISVGFLSAIVDNIPVMFAVLTMKPDMSLGQWLLVTLTAGTGGSMLSIGSAAGVALMGQARGYYTFVNHLKWSWAIMLGYLAGIICHLWLNARFF